MGIHDRDYYRDGSNSFLDAWNRQGWTVWLVAITCGVFFGQCVTGNPQGSPLVEIGAYAPEKVAAGEVWRLFTPMFLHFGVWHLFCNMLVLYWVGSRLEDIYGRGEFVAFYLFAGITAQLFYFLVWLSGGPGNSSIGASGAVMAAFVLFAFHFPHQRILVNFIIPVPVWLCVVIYVALDVLGTVGVGGGNTAYFVHLGGAFFGAVYYQTELRFGDLVSRSPRRARRGAPQLRIVPAEPEPDTPEPTPVRAAVGSQPQPRDTPQGNEPPDSQIEKRVDQVLAKVSKYGQGSLTPEEREILVKASEIYKKRRK